MSEKKELINWLEEVKQTIILQNETNEYNRGAKQGKLYLIDLVKRKLKET